MGGIPTHTVMLSTESLLGSGAIVHPQTPSILNPLTVNREINACRPDNNLGSLGEY